MYFPDTHARATPDKAAYVIGDRAVSYRELVEVSKRIANLLRERGLRPGDVVAVVLPNMVGMLEVAWACQRSGLRYTAINHHLRPSEIEYILKDSAASAVFTSTEFADSILDAMPSASDRPMRFTVDGPADEFEDLPVLLRTVPAAPTGLEVEGTDLLYSSGTTGRPKGIAASLTLAPLGTLPSTSQFLSANWDLDDTTVYLSPAPLYHAAPLRSCMTIQRFGGTVVVMERFDAGSALQLIERHRVTHTQMVPTMFVRLLQLDPSIRESVDTSSLRAVIHAAAPCPPAVKKAMIDWLGPIVDEYYSSTEAPLISLIRSEEALQRPGSVGRPVYGTPHILDERGEEVPAGTPGTIWSEGGTEFEYLNDPDKTAASRNDRGWRTVGDLGYVDSAGYLYLSDRREDLVLVGGVNVYPQEAENVLMGHPHVADAAVFGVPHEEYGEEVRAVVQLKSGVEPSTHLSETLVDYCRSHLSKVKCPRSIEFSTSLPRTPTGKLLRRVLREERAAQHAVAIGATTANPIRPEDR